MRILIAAMVAVFALVAGAVLGLGHLVTSLSRADEAARTQVAQQQLADSVPAPTAPAPAGTSGGASPVVSESRRQVEEPKTFSGARARARRQTGPVATGAPEGQALVVMRIPRFGRDWRWVALEGTADWVIASGPGHYSRTPLPGERGNVAFAGHRAGHGDPFIDFDRLRAGDRVILSQGDTRWVYRLDGRPTIIPTSASWVLDPLRGHRLTLTTCWPKYGSAKRMYVRGHLTRTEGPGQAAHVR